MPLSGAAPPRILAVIPTYNEADNIARLIPAVLKQAPGMHVLIVDDNSPDGTAKIVHELMLSDDRIGILERPTKAGLGSAYVAGFREAVKEGYDIILQMDADFSHDPNDIHSFLQAIDGDGTDLVLGSRYAGGVRILNWPIRRLLLSYGANVYTRIMTGLPLTDATGGFKCFKREVLQSIDLSHIRSNGYAFQIEMSYKAWKKGFRMVEIPIIFLDRRRGKSKMSKQIVYEALFMLWKLRFQSIFHRL